MKAGGNKEVAGIIILVAGGSSFIILFYCVFIKQVYMVLTRQQRERLVLDLYNQGKNTREIAEEARMSFSAIGAILKKAEQEKEANKSKNRKDVPSLPSLQTIFRTVKLWHM